MRGQVLNAWMFWVLEVTILMGGATGIIGPIGGGCIGGWEICTPTGRGGRPGMLLELMDEWRLGVRLGGGGR